LNVNSFEFKDSSNPIKLTIVDTHKFATQLNREDM